MIASRKLDHVAEYYFATKLREVRELVLAGKPIINAAIGNPDLPPPPQALAALTTALTDASAHGYQSYLGLSELREAMSQFYKRHYEVTLNPANEVIPLMGSKEGILHISMAFLNPGDEVLIPDPGYPTYASATRLCEAIPVPYNLTAQNGWLPDLDALEKRDLSKVKIIWVNYPNMPTGAAATSILFTDLVAFASRHNILIINDNPYSCVGYDKKHSILQAKGAMDVALELNSISKTFNMAGWRVGMLAGNAQLIQQVLKVKTNMDSGMFYGIQKGAIAALQSDESWFENINAVYAKRRAVILQIARALGLQPEVQNAGLFVWCKLPHGEQDDKAFVESLLHEQHIFIAPGSIFGSNGVGYVRFSLCIPDAQLQTMLERLNLSAL
ncbi:MAG: aminotransferase class I/II-fold pyridoxal phosphate-dependent enzyme [Nonlabens sp.]|nr:aminotransferase class I/II-fold pyridoxal phosphate-dependent enzyme [Nonlabens sp.]